MGNILKLEFYDEFNCTADRCSFTCCEGWEIVIDTDTYNKWKSNAKHSGYLCKNAKIKKDSNGPDRYIKMKSSMRCPFLDDKGLCNIFIKCGENYMSNTCKLFPRQKNSLENLKEYSLSCACPTVVDHINKINGKMKFSYDGDETIWDTISVTYKLREGMLTILQKSNFPLTDRILLIFHMLLFMKKEPVITKEVIRKYQDENYLLSLFSIWSGTKVENEDSCQEIKELFLDIVENYRLEKSYSFYLKDIADLAEELETDNSHSEWNTFNMAFGQYEQLMEHCLLSKIFANCISDDLDEMILSFQMLITEYVMVKYSVFLGWLLNKKGEIEYSDIRDYIVIYSRIIGYNTDGMIEFWEDSFEEAVWDFGYMLLIMN